MKCKHSCRLCERFTTSNTVTFTDGNLVINIDAGSYDDGDCCCLVVTDAIPLTTTREAPVFITIGTGTELYPLTDCYGLQLTQENIFTRRLYKVCVRTNATGGAFRIMGHLPCYPRTRLASIDGTAPTEGGTGA